MSRTYLLRETTYLYVFPIERNTEVNRYNSTVASDVWLYATFLICVMVFEMLAQGILEGFVIIASPKKKSHKS